MRVGLALPVALILGLAGCGGGAENGSKPEPLRGADSVDAHFGGVEQKGSALGSPNAPYTLVEFADLQCPFCARFHRSVVPELVERFVRPGRLRIELRPVAFLGADSSPAAAAAVAAGQQDRMWEFADLFYRNQGAENSGYVTPEFLGQLAQSIPGLDFEVFQAASGTEELVTELKRNASAAHTARISGTPGFRLGRTGRTLAPFEPQTLEREPFLDRLERAL